MSPRSIAAAAFALAFAVSLVSATPAIAEPSAAAAPFVAQARAAGLTASQANWMQAEADRYLKVAGGRQVAPNRIELDGATLLIALPGEARPRDFATTQGVAAASNCNGGAVYGHFCAYRGVNRTGSQFDMYKCNRYSLPNWTGNGSFADHQTQYTLSSFFENCPECIYDQYYAPASSDSYNWTPVWSIRNCG